MSEREKHIQPAKLFRFRNGINAFEMKNGLAAMVLAQPAGFQKRAARLVPAFGLADKNFLQFCEAFRKIRKDFGSDFALVATRSKDARNQDPAWSFRAQWELRTARRSMESMPADRSIFENFQCEALVKLHPSSAQKRSNGFDRPPLPPYDLT